MPLFTQDAPSSPDGRPVGNHLGEEAECSGVSIVAITQIDLDDAKASAESNCLVRDLPVLRKAHRGQNIDRLAPEPVSTILADALDVLSQMIPDPGGRVAVHDHDGPKVFINPQAVEDSVHAVQEVPACSQSVLGLYLDAPTISELHSHVIASAARLHRYGHRNVLGVGEEGESLACESMRR